MPDAAEFGQRAFQFAARFCFPRLSGTPGDRDAQELIKKTFSGLDLAPVEDKFPASYLMISLSRFALVPIGIFIFGGYCFYLMLAFKLAVFSFLMALLLGLGFMIYCQGVPHFLGRRKKHWTSNIFSRIGSESPEQEILLVAHYDSKSQTFPAWLRVLIYYGGSILSLIGIGIFLGQFLYINNFDLEEIRSSLNVVCIIPDYEQWSYYYHWFWFFLGVAIIDFLPLLNRLGNRSAGATDNAGAMGVIFELARIFQSDPLKKSRLWLVMTGAEELGLLGARAFIENHAAELDPIRTMVINLDLLGSDFRISGLSRLGFPGIKTDRAFNQMVKAIAEKNGLPFRLDPFSIGFATDAYPFLKKGYRTIDLGSFNRWFHTEADTVDKLNPANLGDYVQVIQRLIQDLDQK